MKEVFDYLSKKDHLEKIRLVCRQWYRISQKMYPVQACITMSNNVVFKRLSNDLKDYPVFNSKLKKMIVQRHRFDFLFTGDEFFSLVESIPNMTEVEFNMALTTEKLADLLYQLETLARQDKIKLQTLLLKVYVNCENVESGQVVPYFRTNLRGLLRNFAKELCEFRVNTDFSFGQFSFDGIIDKDNIVRWPMHFYSLSNGDEESNHRLHTLHIVNLYCTMSRECINYIIFGHFTQLKTLQLYLAVRESRRAKDDIWNYLKNYCTSSLQSYNIYIRDGFNELLSKFNSTDNEDEIYAELLSIEYDYFLKEVDESDSSERSSYYDESEPNSENFDSSDESSYDEED